MCPCYSSSRGSSQRRCSSSQPGLKNFNFRHPFFTAGSGGGLDIGGSSKLSHSKLSLLLPHFLGDLSCALAAAMILGVEVNWEKPQLSASLGLCKSVAEEVDVGVGGNR